MERRARGAPARCRIPAADVAGYSRLIEQDAAGALAGIRAHRQELIHPQIVEHKGRIVKTTGDGILIEFPSVVEAVACAALCSVEWASETPGQPRNRGSCSASG